MSKKPRVLVAMSGGVDSSVAAAMLVEQGYEVIGVTMQVWDYSQCSIEEGLGTCCSSSDVDDARSVADLLGIPFYVIDCEDEFKEKVINPFVNDYMNGKTPLPCVNCNTYLKFDHLIEKMKELECDYLATGHYARIEKKTVSASVNDMADNVTDEAPNQLPNQWTDEWTIVTSTDDWKDQTYFLFTIPTEIIPRLMFPIGAMKKPDVRKYAEEKNLVVARKKDSTGICFVGTQGYDKFIADHYPDSPVTKGVVKRYPQGEVLAEHSGIHHFTYGQRKGLGFSAEQALYVIKVDASTGDVWVGEEKYLFQSEMTVEKCQWHVSPKPGQELNVKIRYAHKGGSAVIEQKADGKYVVKFKEPQRAITPGQAAVVYDGDRLLGGGWICP